MNFKRQIHVMSKDKYLCIFLCQMEAAVFFILENFSVTLAVFENWGIFDHMTCLEQL